MLRDKLTGDTPPGWGEDLLTQYIDDARGNQFATFWNTDVGRRLVEVDALFYRACGNAINPKPMVPMLFLLRAHSSWRTAAMLAMAGAAYEAVPLLRSVLELAAYGVRIMDDEAIFKTWISRGDGDDEKNQAIEQFKKWRLEKAIRALGPKMEEDFKVLYDRTIDLGAHPNSLGFLVGTKMTTEPGRRQFDQVYLHDGGEPMRGVLKTCRQVGMWALTLYGVVYATRWNLLGVHADLERMRRDPESPRPPNTR